MKRWLLVCLMVLSMISVSSVFANTRKDVELNKCTDGDTAHFLIDGQDTTVRFLAIDTPEYTKEKEPYGKEASDFTCLALRQAMTITLEYDPGSDETDKYGRDLAWVFVDGELLQKQLVAQGLAEVKYIYGDYAYTEELYEAQATAQKQKLCIWSDYEADHTDVIVWMVTAIGTVIIVLLSMSRIKGKNKKIKQVKRVMKQITKR